MLRVLGLGTALPKGSIEQAKAATIAATLTGGTGDRRRLLPTIYRRSGVDTRHSVVLGPGSDGSYDPSEPIQDFYLPSQNETDNGPTTAARMRLYEAHAFRLAKEAAVKALDEAKVSYADISHLVTVSCSGFEAPGVDIRLIESLGLPRSTARTNVGFMGCHGAMNGLRVASAYGAMGATVLVVAVELCSLHFQYGDVPDHMVANALFADGAAAMVVKGVAASDSNQGSELRIAAHGAWLVPDSQDAMSWRIGNHGFAMTLDRRVPEWIGEHLKPWLTEWLGEQGHRLEDVASWAVHPGGPKILKGVEDALSLEGNALAESHRVLAECGNMSSPTILFILDRMRRKGVRGPMVALGFGPGLAIEAMLLHTH